MVLSRPFDSFQDHCIFLYSFNILTPNSIKPSQNKSKHVQIKIFKFHCVYCAYCDLCEQIWQSVKNTLKLHDNSNNKIGRQFKFTSEVTLIGPHIVSKFQPNPTIIAKVIHHFVHGSFFQDHPHTIPLCVKLH